MLEKYHSPLVSIIIITYNSAKYIVETLESAKDQTYQHIELIISDDFSSDNTLEICSKWIQEHTNRFVRTEIIRVEKNTGIAPNCNRGVNAATGKWLKLIAGDDTLKKECIKDNVDFVETDKDILFCFSNLDFYKNEIKSENLILKQEDVYDIRSKRFSKLSSGFQLKAMVRNIMLYGPATFINRKAFVEFGGYDESYPFVEDRTTFFNWVLAGNKFHYLPKKTVNYRLNASSITKRDIQESGISDFTTKFRYLILDRFYKHFTLKEKMFFHIKYSYYKFFKDKTKISVFSKVFRRIWYYFVQIGDKAAYNSLNQIYKQYSKSH